MKKAENIKWTETIIRTVPIQFVEYSYRRNNFSYSKHRKISKAAIIFRLLFKENSIFVVGSVASIASPSSNNESWPYRKSLRFASLLHLWHLGYASIADYIIVISSSLVMLSFYWNLIGSLNEILVT